MPVLFCVGNKINTRSTIKQALQGDLAPARRDVRHLSQEVFCRMIKCYYRMCAAIVCHMGFAIAIVASPAPVQAAPDWPSEVIARYDISFAGFNVGSFDFRSSVHQKRYLLAGEANISAVFGAFEWQALTRSSGEIAPKRPAPKAYVFDYSSKSLRGSVRIEFMKGHIIRSDVSPYSPYTNQYVPLRSEHMRDVYDPISALMVLTRSTTEHPCRRRIPIFDGKQRFDILLSPHGQTQISEASPSGQPAHAYVCKVQYIPLGGYKPNAHTRYMISNSGMRIVLRAVPSANLYIPYEVRIPTIAGEAVLSSRKVNIITAKRQRIALVHTR